MTAENHDPLTENLGILCEQIEPGISNAILAATPEHCNKYGYVHGAVLFAMADIGMGFSGCDRSRAPEARG